MLSFAQVKVGFAVTVVLVAGFVSSTTASHASERGTFSGAMPTTYPSWFKQSFLELEDDVAEASDAGKRVLVVFHQDGCPYCNALVERNLSQRDIETYLKKNFDIIEMNIWGDRPVANVGGKEYTEKSFAAALKVQYTPTLLFFNETGRIILRLNGYLPPDTFKLALEYVAGRHEAKMTYRDYREAHLPAPSSKRLIAEDFFAAAPHDLNARGDSGKPVAVYFEQRDCPACEELHKNVLRLPETRKLADKFHSIQLDMWGDTPVALPTGRSVTARDWAKALDVAYAPTIVLFNAAGEEVMRADSTLKSFHVQSILDYVVSGAYKDEPNFQRFISARAEHFIEQGKDVNIWK